MMTSQSHSKSYALLRLAAENLGLKKREENHYISKKTEPIPVNLFLQGVDWSNLLSLSMLATWISQFERLRHRTIDPLYPTGCEH
jgi:hypothetical protein